VLSTLRPVQPPTSSSSRVPARVGLVGNPSDGYGGAVLAAIVDDLAATVRATPIDRGVRLSNDTIGTVAWPSTAAFDDELSTAGHATGHRIVTASLQALGRHLGFLPAASIEWSSTIPRSVGLAGSSAIAVAVIEAVAELAGRRLDPRVVAALALDAETTGLGIPAGWQDRIVQAHRGAVLVDAGETTVVDGVDVPVVGRLPALDLPTVVAWREQDAEESGAYHADLRRRADGDELAAAMTALAEVARRAADSVARGEQRELIEAVGTSWALRASSMPLGPLHEQLVEAARVGDAVATSPGSGGSVVAMAADGGSLTAAVAALQRVGAEVLHVRLR